MSKYWLWSELKDKVQRDLDLEGETFITEVELLGYANEAIDEVERQILTLYEDYFLTRATLTLVQDQEAYDLPADIYATKVRGLIYRKGTTVYRLDRMRDWRKFEEHAVFQSGTHYDVRYGWFMVNTTAGNPEILLCPPPREVGPYVTVWYIRNANTLTVDASVCDMPEAANYIMQYMKVRCYEKEHHPMLQKALMDLDKEKADTIATLATKEPDNQNLIEADMSIYDEMS